MLASIRRFAKTWVAAVIIGLLIVSFAIFGINDVFTRGFSDAVVKAGSREVTVADFRRAFDNWKAEAEQRMGQPITAQMAAENGVITGLLEQIAAREAFGELLGRLGVRPADGQITERLRTMTAFFDPISGRFDQDAYAQRLSENNITPAEFEQSIRDEIAERHLISGVAAGLRAPLAFSALGAAYELETRDLAYVAVDVDDVEAVGRPTDEQLMTFMRANADQLMQPERRVFTLVHFDPQNHLGAAQIDEAELARRFEFRKDSLAVAETRTVVQVPAKDQASAQRIAARLAAGETPQAVAQANGVEPVVFENRPRTAIPDRKVAAAAFALQAGAVSQPIQGDLGWAVVKVTEVTPGRTPTLEGLRPLLETELRRDVAVERVYEMSQVYEDARDAGDNIVEAARKAGVPAVTLPPLTREGGTPDRTPVPGLEPEHLETAFSLPQGGQSELIDMGDGRYYAIRVDRVIEPALPPLDEVRAPLTQIWMQRQMLDRLTARADAVAEKIREGQTLEQAAAELGTRVVRTSGLDRRNAQERTDLSNDALANAFAVKPGEVFVARNVRFGLLVGKLEATHPPGGANLARLTADTRGQMTVGLFQELGQAARDYSRRAVDVDIDEARARTALGLEPETEAAPAKSSAESKATAGEKGAE